jgi:UDP-3-O-acyl-N-acetylglucosamine deacetylase
MQDQISPLRIAQDLYGPQRSIVRRATVAGFGFWTGKDVTLEFLPAPENFGIRFARSESEEAPVPAHLAYRAEKPHQTSLKAGNLRFDMTEHVLAALAGFRIDNCLIRIDGEEMPGIDGSARPFAEAIRSAGILEQRAAKSLRFVREPIRIEEGKRWIEALPSKAGEVSYRYELDYTRHKSASPALQKESFEISFAAASNSPQEDPVSLFEKEVAGARTFLTSAEAHKLIEMGLCTRVSPSDVLVFGPDGPIDNSLRYPDECARHKVLDMMGDFSLGGAFIVARLRGHCTGHVQNAALLAKILECTQPE